MFTTLNTTLYRIVFAEFANTVLEGAIHPEGRFHHADQPALYASPSPDTAAIAIQIYLKPDDPPRVLVPLSLRNARMVDLRDIDTCKVLGIDPAWSTVPWSDERAAGRPATSWRASDAARAAGADGMLYASRRTPDRWHVVLFSWNIGNGAVLDIDGTPTRWSPKQ
ncbi:RES family NAD+ phosphorylase [Yoonia sp. GPGPB17]|uniref:RES family NAD+ phosphorylase n=1 Tax=Yoonia sp. GPGPB17 TaxID=3026147 RepID=UPI0030BB875E